MPVQRQGIAWAGLAAGPAAWALNQQLSYSLVPWICARQVDTVPFIALACAAAALAGGALSWRARRAPAAEMAVDPAGGRTHDALAWIGVALAVLFALVILVQGAAGLVFDGCER